MSMCVFFFQAEDGIRDLTVTGVQTCALPSLKESRLLLRSLGDRLPSSQTACRTIISKQPALTADEARARDQQARRIQRSPLEITLLMLIGKRRNRLALSCA